jgi:hypothetical protein
VRDLDSQLTRSRAALLDEIDQPPLADVRRRARRIRRRRAAAAGAAAFVVLATIGIGVRPWQHGTEPVVTASGPPADAPIYRGGGITITGLEPGTLFDLDGEAGDVEFTDPSHGLVAAICAKTCPSVARTADGGLTWQRLTLPDEGSNLPDLVAFPGGRWLMVTETGYRAPADGVTWQPVSPPEPATRAAIGADELPRLDEATNKVAVWSSERGPLGLLKTQPGLTVRWVSPAPNGDGTWWVGGVAGAEPAVAVTRDAGRTWTRTVLPGPVGETSTVTIGALGKEVYAVSQGESGELRGVYFSADSGRTFAPNYTGEPGKAPAAVAGDPVPLLDGRLLLVQPGGTPSAWWVSEDEGRSFTAATGLPAVGAIHRTYAGYVAYRLFDGGWAAFSANGSDWQKLQFS